MPTDRDHESQRANEPAWTSVDFEGPIRQGELLADVVEYRVGLGAEREENGAKVAVDPVNHAFLMVASQDCDLIWDFKARDQPRGAKIPTGAKDLPHVLVLEVRRAGSVRQMGINEGTINTRQWELIATNRHERYQFLESVPAALDLATLGIPELVIDFKRLFSIPTDLLDDHLKRCMSANPRRARLRQPYREHLQNRMVAYYARVGLPLDHRSAHQSAEQ